MWIIASKLPSHLKFKADRYRKVPGAVDYADRSENLQFQAIRFLSILLAFCNGSYPRQGNGQSPGTYGLGLGVV